jgi:hypothetical protein
LKDEFAGRHFRVDDQDSLLRRLWKGNVGSCCQGIDYAVKVNCHQRPCQEESRLLLVQHTGSSGSAGRHFT